MIDVRIDAPGAGAWVMERVGGRFVGGVDHSFTAHAGEQVLGGFVLTAYTGGSMTMHVAGEGRRWCTRDLLWLAFHYTFEQVGCYKIISPVRSDNYASLLLALQIGGSFEAVLMDVFEPGVHMVILTMTKDACRRWLDHTPTQWRAANG